MRRRTFFWQTNSSEQVQQQNCGGSEPGRQHLSLLFHIAQPFLSRCVNFPTLCGAGVVVVVVVVITERSCRAAFSYRVASPLCSRTKDECATCTIGGPSLCFLATLHNGLLVFVCLLVCFWICHSHRVGGVLMYVWLGVRLRIYTLQADSFVFTFLALPKQTHAATNPFINAVGKLFYPSATRTQAHTVPNQRQSVQTHAPKLGARIVLLFELGTTGFNDGDAAPFKLLL